MPTILPASVLERSANQAKVTSPFSLFEVSWEVCNHVSGIHTILVTKAKTMVERLGDDYVAVGPWLLGDKSKDLPFREETGFESFAEACRGAGLPVRVGRWLIPGAPRTVLVEFSSLYGKRDEVLTKLWEEFMVDSLSGGWDYVEPVLFGHAAGHVIEKWWDEYLAPRHRRAVLHAHDWRAGASILYAKKRVPNLATTFTSHGTVLGRALGSRGQSVRTGLGTEPPEQHAQTHNVAALHSLEGVTARAADVLTTVSAATALELERLHNRKADNVLPNGIDLEVIDALAGETQRAETRASLCSLAQRFLGEDVAKATLLGVSGRYDFHNEGIDVLLDALARLNQRPGQPVVAFLLLPAGNSGLRAEVIDRLARPLAQCDGPAGLTTHNLFDEERDPLRERAARLGLDNRKGSRVKIIHVPIRVHAQDGLLNAPYHAVMRGFDLTCFPSYYQPWGHAAQESLSLGVPTITTDCAGFGAWALAAGLQPETGVSVLRREAVADAEVVTALVELLEQRVADARDTKKWMRACRATVVQTSWADLIVRHESAWKQALECVQQRSTTALPAARRPRLEVAVQPTPGRTPRLNQFHVSATVPAELRGLERLARNFWWCWDPDAPELFATLSPRSWEACHHNPVAFLQRVFPEDLAAKAHDPAFVTRVQQVLRRFDTYMAQTVLDFPLGPGAVLTQRHPIAYFCAEYALHESLPIYSGGLGVLAGDHLKSASDLNVPLIAVGLFYRMGYMAQRLSTAGDQVALDRENDPQLLPLEQVKDEHGKALEVSIPLPGGQMTLRAWKVRVGRVSLYLLDANTPSNRPEDQDITRNLYGGDHEMRIRQEIALGRGGVKLLRRLGIQPAVWHMNEGHAAFLTLERTSQLVGEEGLTFEAAREFVRATTMFTTHTPVPAGHDRFGEDLMRRYFSDCADWVGLPWEKLYALGHSETEKHTFNVTMLALNFASSCNGVSRLHGVASRQLLHSFWPGLIEAEIPIGSITNGVHLATWTHKSICEALGVIDRPIRGEDFAKAASQLDRADLWRRKQVMKRQLIERAKHSLKRAFLERNDSPHALNRMLDGLNQDALLIGFARRFAPYKRAHLLFSDLERLRRILEISGRPTRILIAGKAHPRDTKGQEILKSIVELSRRDGLIGKVMFLEDYDMDVARALVQGVDVWLNNPRRMQEASGTSGMKAAANGALNLSIGDGWWPEAYDGRNGWMIADGRVYDNEDLQDQFDAAALYRLLEDELLPRYFDRDAHGVPQQWLDLVLHDLTTVPPTFNTDRMVGEYLEQAYRPLGRAFFDFSSDKKAKAKAMAHDAQRVRKGFGEIKIVSVKVAELRDFRVGEPIEVSLEVDLGSLSPDDVIVELLLGHAKGERDLQGMVIVPLQAKSATSGPVYAFEGSRTIERSGNYAHGLRVRARQASEPGSSLRDLVLWA